MSSRDDRTDDRTKSRIPNKTGWALEDIVSAANRASTHWDGAMKRAEKHMDTVMILHLARLRDRLAEIERLASDALEGKYGRE